MSNVRQAAVSRKELREFAEKLWADGRNPNDVEAAAGLLLLDLIKDDANFNPTVRLDQP